MYCIVRCPYCRTIQGGLYPVKRTRCQICSRSINLTSIGPVAVFDDHSEMQAVLRVMKLKNGGDEGIKDVVFDTGIEKTTFPTGKGRDGLRNRVLMSLHTEMNREELVLELTEEGYDRELIEDVIDELTRSGMIHYPRYDVLKKA